MFAEENLEKFYGAVASVFEVLGTCAIVVGFIFAVHLCVRTLRRGQGYKAAFESLRVTIGGSILLGLEIMVAADLVRTITSDPTMQEMLILGLIVIIRTVLSMSIQIEIDGTLPWKRALTTSGAQIVAQQAKK